MRGLCDRYMVFMVLGETNIGQRGEWKSEDEWK